jgi:NAD-dependent deacetylase
MTAVEESEVADWVAASERLVVLTGAGISTESGIQDFRGPDGLWTRDPAAEARANINYYREHREARVAVWRRRLESPQYAGEPNTGHLALGELDRQGRLHLLLTQNVDGLHQRGGVDPERVVELHGTVREFMCLSCDARGPIGVVLDRVRGGEDDPRCEVCGGILKAATVSFGQALFPGDMERAEVGARQSDLFIAIGSTLQVYPVAALVPLAKRSGARLVIINDAPTPFDDVADAVMRGRIGQVLPALVPVT